MNEYLFKNMCNQVAKRHKMDPKNLSSFPNELLQQIFDYLPITDCQSIKDAYSNTGRSSDFNKVYDERISLERYFRNSGFDGKEMMKTLADCHTFLTGPKALEYFVPGSTDGETEWNFLVGVSLQKRYNMMIRMQNLGVEWENLSDMIKRNLIFRDGELCSKIGNIKAALENLRSEYSNIDSNGSIDLDQATFEDIIVEVNNFPVKFNNHSDDAIIHLYYDDSETINSLMIEAENLSLNDNINNDMYGTINLNGTRNTITLSFEHEDDHGIMKFLHRIPLSADQCFISGFGATHLYGDAASKRISYKWDHPSLRFDAANNSIETKMISSYMQRGFTIMYKPGSDRTGGTWLNSTSDGVIYVPGHNNINWDDTHFSFTQTMYHDLLWQESCLCTLHGGPDSQILTGIELVKRMHELDHEKLKQVDRHYLIDHAVI